MFVYLFLPIKTPLTILSSAFLCHITVQEGCINPFSTDSFVVYEPAREASAPLLTFVQGEKGALTYQHRENSAMLRNGGKYYKEMPGLLAEANLSRSAPMEKTVS